MRRGYTFNVDLEIDRHKLRVTGFKVAEVPEVRATMGDPGAPAEGGELEDVEVFMVKRVLRPRVRGGAQSLRGRRLRRHQYRVELLRQLPDVMVRKLDLDDSIYRALEDR